MRIRLREYVKNGGGVDDSCYSINVVCCFFFYGYGDHRDLHRVDRRQRQMCIRDRARDGVLLAIAVAAVDLDGVGYDRRARFAAVEQGGCLLYTSPSPRDS